MARLQSGGNAPNPATWGIVREQMVAGFPIQELNQPARRWLPRHAHEHASISFVLSGSYRETARGRETDCTPYTVVVKPPHEPHTDRFGDEGGQCLLIEIPSHRLEHENGLLPGAGAPRLLHNSAVSSAGARIRRELRGLDSLSGLAMEALVLDVLVSVTRAVAAERTTDPPPWLLRTREHLHDCLHELPSLSHLAAGAGVHPAHLARAFRKHFGASVGEYVRRLRIDRAATELATSDESIAGIALRYGFFDQSHFSRAFKRQVGQTPAAYRACAR